MFSLLLFLPVVVVVVLGVVVLGVELSLLLLLLPLAWAGQVLGLLPWRLVLTATDGTRTWEEVRGTRAMLQRRQQLRALVTRTL
jgi:membrane protein implicated in regulation of membrane protease activity